MSALAMLLLRCAGTIFASGGGGANALTYSNQAVQYGSSAITYG